MQIKITGSLRHRYAPILHKPHRLKLELAAELPSSHSHSPVPSNTLSRCPRNQQQATPFQLVLALDPKTVVILVQGDFDCGFTNTEIDETTARGFNRHFVGHFGHFDSITHLVSDREELVEDMTWAPYDLIEDSERRIGGNRDFQTVRPQCQLTGNGKVRLYGRNGRAKPNVRYPADCVEEVDDMSELLKRST